MGMRLTVPCPLTVVGDLRDPPGKKSTRCQILYPPWWWWWLCGHSATGLLLPSRAQLRTQHPIPWLLSLSQPPPPALPLTPHPSPKHPSWQLCSLTVLQLKSPPFSLFPRFENERQKCHPESSINLNLGSGVTDTQTYSPTSLSAHLIGQYSLIFCFSPVKWGCGSCTSLSDFLERLGRAKHLVPSERD